MFHRQKSETYGAEAGTADMAEPAPEKTTFNTSRTEEKAMNSTNDSSEGNTGARPIDMPTGTASFQRPGQMAQAPRMAPGNAYAPAPYPGATSYGIPGTQGSTGGTVVKTSYSDGRRLVIGEGITISGEIEACDTLVVEGTVEAALKGASVLEVSENGVFYGTVEIDECVIAGRFEGELTVNGRLTVKSTGSITGSMSYKELAVESGATVDGKVTPLTAKGAMKSDKSGKGTAKQPGKSRDSQPDGSELPFGSGNVAAAG